jgi:hypothetical protein
MPTRRARLVPYALYGVALVALGVAHVARADARARSEDGASAASEAAHPPFGVSAAPSARTSGRPHAPALAGIARALSGEAPGDDDATTQVPSPEGAAPFYRGALDDHASVSVWIAKEDSPDAALAAYEQTLARAGFSPAASSHTFVKAGVVAVLTASRGERAVLVTVVETSAGGTR